jgi:folylpolyglutamate synthase/dihydropteroate synthase
MLRDKAIDEVLAQLAPRVDHWHLVDLSTEHRGASLVELRDALPDIGSAMVDDCRVLSSCLETLDREVQEDDLVLVFGSFLTVGKTLDWMDESGR